MFHEHRLCAQLHFFTSWLGAEDAVILVVFGGYPQASARENMKKKKKKEKTTQDTTLAIKTEDAVTLQRRDRLSYNDPITDP